MFFTQKKLSRDFLGFILDLREGFQKKTYHALEGRRGVWTDQPFFFGAQKKDKIVKLDQSFMWFRNYLYLPASEYFFLRCFPQCTAALIPPVFSAPLLSTNCTLGEEQSHFDHLKQKSPEPQIESLQ